MEPIYHIASRPDWEAARESGEYRTSTLGQSLAEVGFIHASTGSQVAPTANAFYRNVGDLVVLEIDPSRVAAEIRYEHVPGSPEPFPHIYGPLNAGAVVRTVSLAPGPDGDYHFGDYTDG